MWELTFQYNLDTFATGFANQMRIARIWGDVRDPSTNSTWNVLKFDYQWSSPLRYLHRLWIARLADHRAPTPPRLAVRGGLRDVHRVTLRRTPLRVDERRLVVGPHAMTNNRGQGPHCMHSHIFIWITIQTVVRFFNGFPAVVRYSLHGESETEILERYIRNNYFETDALCFAGRGRC